MTTSTYRLSEHVSEYMTESERAPVVGRRAVVTTHEGERRVGTLMPPHPVIVRIAGSSEFPVGRRRAGGDCFREMRVEVPQDR